MIVGMHYMGLLYSEKMYSSKNDFVDVIFVVLEVKPLASCMLDLYLPLSYTPSHWWYFRI